jgi:hypothetical protein
VLELASLGVPTMVICQNGRELTHHFASSENGVLNLGFRGDVTDVDIEHAFIQTVESCAVRRLMIDRTKKLDLSQGKRRVIAALSALL